MRVPYFKKSQITESGIEEIIEQVNKTLDIAKPNKTLGKAKVKKSNAKEPKDNERKEILNSQEVNVPEEKINEEYILYIREGSEQDVRAMIKIGADKDYDGGSSPPLFIAYERYSESESYYSRNESLNILNYLIDIGIDFDAKHKGNTILMHILEDIAHVEILLFRSKEPNYTNELLDIFKKVASKSKCLNESDFYGKKLLDYARSDLRDTSCDDEGVLCNDILGQISDILKFNGVEI